MVNLASYDWILVNSSAGKDSQAMLDYVVEQAGPSLRDRIVVVHADLGRVEWAGTRELAEEQAAHYGLRCVVVKREQGDLLTQIEQRGMWPSNKARYCTSDQKRAPIRKVMTALAAEVRGPYGKQQTRILNCMGLRADESPARKAKPAFTFDESASNGRRHVDTWLPIHDWSTEQVWARIKASGVRHHRAYDLGMGRLSCCFCVFAPKAALLIAGRENPELLDAYVATEARIGHTFRHGFALAEVKATLATGLTLTPVGADWKL